MVWQSSCFPGQYPSCHQEGGPACGAIVDAPLIAAPCSTKNCTRQRDLQMHHTKKGKQWYFGMTAYIGVDADSGVVHYVSAQQPTLPMCPR